MDLSSQLGQPLFIASGRLTHPFENFFELSPRQLIHQRTFSLIDRTIAIVEQCADQLNTTSHTQTGLNAHAKPVNYPR